MTNIEILEDILGSYSSNNEWQSEIATRYHINQKLISDLLQICGFDHHKHNDSGSIDIDLISQESEIQKVCDKIRSASKM